MYQCLETALFAHGKHFEHSIIVGFQVVLKQKDDKKLKTVKEKIFSEIDSRQRKWMGK